MTKSELPIEFDTIDAPTGRKVARVRLNRPRQLNALNLEMCELMRDQLLVWQSDESIVAVVLSGNGDKGFCAGGDVAEVVRQVRAGGPQRHVYGDRFFSVEYQLDRMIHEYGKPFLSLVHGVCMGGGVGLAVGASHRIVSQGLRMAMPEIHIGLFPDVGGGWFLNRMPAGAGMIMALTGLAINEADALFGGLADYFIPTDGHAALLDALAELPWTGQSAADRVLVTGLCLRMHRQYRAQLVQSPLSQYQDALRYIGMQPTVPLIVQCLQAAAQEDPYFEGPAQSLASGSPTGALVTLRYLQETRQKSLAQVLELDSVLARQFQRRSDFCEGVRALLIDKDRKPQWSPGALDEVPAELVAAHFQPC
jgi:enoyl-CoA hydratase/carnithine racemase